MSGVNFEKVMDWCGWSDADKKACIKLYYLGSSMEPEASAPSKRGRKAGSVKSRRVKRMLYSKAELSQLFSSFKVMEQCAKMDSNFCKARYMDELAVKFGRTPSAIRNQYHVAYRKGMC